MSKSTALDKILNFTPCKDRGSQGDDSGASGESSSTASKQTDFKNQVEETQSASPKTCLPDESSDKENNGPGIFCIIGYYILRTVFYLTALTIIVVCGLYAAKLSGVYDPCEKYYMAKDDCTVTPYMKGMLYHVECVEEKTCLLPGFWISNSRKDWSLKKPSSDSKIEIIEK